MQINVAEKFLSLQGEGPTTGRPAFFLRLQHCVLNCKWCDTAEVWRKGQPMSQVEFELCMNGVVLKMQQPRLIITGGEPLMQQKVWASWLRPFVLYPIRNSPDPEKLVPDYTYLTLPVEVETAGTLKPIMALMDIVQQWNISPKLANSGEPERKRLNAEALHFFGNYVPSNKQVWKFVLSEEAELVEVESILKMAGVKRRESVWLMPCAATRQALLDLSPKVAELARDHGYNFSNRLHLMLWDQATGV